MEEIKKYIDRFFSRKKMNERYAMYAHELATAAEETEHDMFNALTTTFDLGYVRGYRACKAEMKKRGAAV